MVDPMVEVDLMVDPMVEVDPIYRNILTNHTP
jgi:hypothetical protein